MILVLLRLCLQGWDWLLQGRRRQATMQSWSLWTLHIWGTGRLMPVVGESCECSILVWKAGSVGNRGPLLFAVRELVLVLW